MTVAYAILLLFAVAAFLLAVCPVLLMLLCASVQGQLSGRHLPYPLIMPALTGMAWLLCGCYAEQGDGWRAMLWTMPHSWARMSFIGTMLGWVVSRNAALKRTDEN